MANVLGINAVFHDPAAALVVDGEVVAATEEERFTRRCVGAAPIDALGTAPCLVPRSSLFAHA